MKAGISNSSQPKYSRSVGRLSCGATKPNASHDREANSGDHRDGRKCAQGKHDDFVFRTPVHIKLHLFGEKRLNGLWVSENGRS
jgi:hypothetical protein